MSNDIPYFTYMVAGIVGYAILRVLIEVLVFRKCSLCGHPGVLHKSMRFSDRKVIGCRITDCECYKEEKSPDFLRDCYGMEEHDAEGFN